MPKVTTKALEDIILKHYKRNASYVGILDDYYPKKFVFFEWDEYGNKKKTLYIREDNLLRLLK